MMSHFIMKHPLSIVTSVSLSNGDRIHMGRQVELDDEQKGLLEQEFPDVKVMTPEQVEGQTEAAEAERVEHEEDSRQGVPSNQFGALPGGDDSDDDDEDVVGGDTTSGVPDTGGN